MDAFLLDMMRQPLFAGSLLLGAVFQLVALAMLALPSLQARRRRAQAARRAARPEQAIVAAVAEELSQEEAAAEAEEATESEEDGAGAIEAAGDGDDAGLLAMLDDDDEEAEEPAADALEEEEMDFDADLSDIFEEDIVVDPAFRALTASLETIGVMELLGKARDVRQQLAAR